MDVKLVSLESRIVKGVGGGQGQIHEKLRFLVILIANFVYFHLLFTEFENSDPLTQN